MESLGCEQVSNLAMFFFCVCMCMKALRYNSGCVPGNRMNLLAAQV